MTENSSRSTPPPPAAQTGFRLKPGPEDDADAVEPELPTMPIASRAPLSRGEPGQNVGPAEEDWDATATPALPPVEERTTTPEPIAKLERLDGELTEDDFVEARAPAAEELRSAPGSSSRKLVLVPEAEASTLPRNADSETTGPPAPLSASENLVGEIIDGRYKLESVLGIGSMGVVYAARHVAVGKLVAVKALRPHLMQDAEVVQRFSAEATAATAIGNAHIVDTLDYGTLPDGSAFLVMELLDGRSLSEVLRAEGPLPLERILRIAAQIAIALGAAHEAGIVHRDLKPDNVFLIERDGQPDFVKILDFGIAKFGAGQNKLTHAGAVFGTPHYMSPEQALGKATDGRTDIYALGVILYEMATGKVPFDGESPVAVLTLHATETPRPLAKSGRKLPRSFEAAVMKCLAKEPDDRYPTMAALAADLERVRSGSLTEAERAVLPEAPALPVAIEHPSFIEGLRPRKGLKVGLLLAALAASAGGWFVWKKRTSAVPAPVVSVTPKPPPLASASIELPSADQVPTHDVALVLFPLDARVFLGDEDLGQMPVTVKVKEGQPVKVRVVRDGYWTRKVTLDGKKKRVVVGLWKKQGNAPPPSDSSEQGDPTPDEAEERAAAPAATASAPAQGVATATAKQEPVEKDVEETP